MTLFARLSETFSVNWTTLLVGWDRPWESPAVLSTDDIDSHATERLASGVDARDEALIVELLALDLPNADRALIRRCLARLSDLCRSDPSSELRKWRVVLLEQLLENLATDPVYGLIALTEFWLGFGFPPDSPHEVQGRDNSMSASEYYQEDNYRRLLLRHRSWIEQEKRDLGAD